MTAALRIRLFALLAALAAFLPVPLAAQTDGASLRAFGMGDAFVAGGNSNGAIFHNPAGIVTASMYSAEAGYVFRDGNNSSAATASIIDSSTNPNIGAGVAYTYGFGGAVDDVSSAISDHDIRFALSSPAVPGRFSIGLGGRYMSVGGRFPFDDEGNEVRSERDKAFTMDVGVMALAGIVTVGAAAQNLIQADDFNLPRRWTAGAGVLSGDFHVEAQYVGQSLAGGGTENVGHGFAIGAEYIAVSVPIRVGFSRDGLTDQNSISTGLGYRSQTFGVDAAFRQNLDENQERTFGGSLSLYF